MSKVERQTLKDQYLIEAKQEQIKSKRKILHGSPLTGAGMVVVVVVRTVEENEYNMKAFKWLDMMYFSEDATGYFCCSAPLPPTHTQKKNNNKKKKKTKQQQKKKKKKTNKKKTKKQKKKKKKKNNKKKKKKRHGDK